MKNIFLIIFLFLTLVSNGQWDNESRYKCERKIEKFKRVRSTGTTLAIFGVIGLCGGVVMAVDAYQNIDRDNSNNYNYYNNNSKTNSSDYIALEGGIILAAVGGAMFITGVVLSSVGGRNVRKYQRNLDVGFRYDNKMKGLRIAYKF
jgi:hypothetical protein